jgi:hypothetical protein
VKDVDKVITVKLDTAVIGPNSGATSSGHLVALDHNSSRGTGQDSGATYNIGAAQGTTAFNGVRVMKSFPTVGLGSLPSTGLSDNRLGRFTVTAGATGPVSLTEFNLSFATSSLVTAGGQLSNVNIYAYGDSAYSNAVGSGTNGAVNLTGHPLTSTGASSVGWQTSATNFEFTVTDSSGASTTLQVPTGTTYYFEVRGTVTGIQSGSSVVTTLKGDSAPAFVAGGRYSNPLGKADDSTPHCALVGQCGFIWSPNSTTTSVVRASADWTDGTSVPGLPSNGLIMTRSQ